VELLEGKPPWSELDSNMAVLFKIVEEEWPIPTRYSDALQDFLGSCFKKNPLERPTAETLFDHAWIREEIGIDPVSVLLSFRSCRYLTPSILL
jgi:serine/threonine protein kinase